jgi:hypothetical protein
MHACMVKVGNASWSKKKIVKLDEEWSRYNISRGPGRVAMAWPGQVGRGSLGTLELGHGQRACIGVP